jgi:methyl acetate hydrolase
MLTLRRKISLALSGPGLRLVLAVVVTAATIGAVAANGIWGLPAAARRAAAAPQKATAAKPSTGIEQVLRDSVGETKLPGVVAMVASGDRVTFQGALGKRDTTKNVPMTPDTIFRIASMTKPVTSVAMMQIIESGRVKLDEPAATYAPELANVQVLDEFDANAKQAKLRAPKTPLTVRQLLTHTAGFAYEFFDPKMSAYAASGAVPSMRLGGDDGFLKGPLMFDPGTRWEYGISTDWVGRIVEKVSGQDLETYFREHIFRPLGMNDTFFNVPPEKQARVVALHVRQDDGSYVEPPPQPLKPVRFFSGGGGLHSTASDYLKFERMLLNGGTLGGKRVLKAETVAEMSRNQIGDLSLLPMTSLMPQFARNPIRIPGAMDKFGLGFGLNTNAVEGGRSAGSLSWAGIYSTYFWIDPAKKTCAVIMMQLLPFSDDAAVTTVEQFERAVYATGAKSATASASARAD